MRGLGVVVAVSNHRVHMKTQIFLAMSAKYDELLKNSGILAKRARCHGAS